MAKPENLTVTIKVEDNFSEKLIDMICEKLIERINSEDRPIYMIEHSMTTAERHAIHNYLEIKRHGLQRIN